MVFGHRPGQSNLHNRVHYEVVPREAWDMLAERYRGGPRIARAVIREGDAYRAELRVEVKGRAFRAPRGRTVALLAPGPSPRAKDHGAHAF